MGKKKVLIAGGNVPSVTFKYPLGPSWSPAGWAGMLCQGYGWWSLLLSIPSLWLWLSCRPSHAHPGLSDKGTTTSVPVCSHTPECDPRARGWDPCKASLAAANPLGFLHSIPARPPALSLFDNWHSSDSLKMTSFFPVSREKREFEIICWVLVLHHTQLVLGQ